MAAWNWRLGEGIEFKTHTFWVLGIFNILKWYFYDNVELSKVRVIM